MLITKLVTQVTKVADFYPVHLKAQDSVTASNFSSSLIMVGRNALEPYPFNLYWGCSFNYLGITLNRSYIIMVAMFMAYGNNISCFSYLTVGQIRSSDIGVGYYLRPRVRC